jgi:hypothetical protein
MKRIKRILVAVVGGTVLALGIALIVLPGPAFLVVPAGLAILAIEFAWAKRWLRKVREWLPGNRVRHQAQPGACPAPDTMPRTVPRLPCDQSNTASR